MKMLLVVDLQTSMQELYLSYIHLKTKMSLTRLQVIKSLISFS